jgi:hypothetical protein
MGSEEIERRFGVDRPADVRRPFSEQSPGFNMTISGRPLGFEIINN